MRIILQKVFMCAAGKSLFGSFWLGTQNRFLDIYLTHKQYVFIFTKLQVCALIWVSSGVCVCICMCEYVRVGGCIPVVAEKCVYSVSLSSQTVADCSTHQNKPEALLMIWCNWINQSQCVIFITPCFWAVGGIWWILSRTFCNDTLRDNTQWHHKHWLTAQKMAQNVHQDRRNTNTDSPKKRKNRKKTPQIHIWMACWQMWCRADEEARTLETR